MSDKGMLVRRGKRPISCLETEISFQIVWHQPLAEKTKPARRCLRNAARMATSTHSMTKIRTDKPGYGIYEDEWQLVAEPFRKGTMPRK